MNLITVIIIAIVIWLVYSLIQSYRNLEKELKEIRAKCIIGSTTASTAATTSTAATATTTKTTETLVSPTQTKKVVVGDTTAPAKTGPPSGAYTPTGDQVYSSDSDTTLHNNDPLYSMRNSLVSGLNSIKNYATI